MRDLFDDFLDELRRKEAEARGEDPDRVAPRRPKPVGPAPERDPDDAEAGEDGDGADDSDSGGSERARRTDTEPGSSGRRRPPRPTAMDGGQDGGSGGRGRRIGLYMAVGVLLLIFIGSGLILDLWTDVLWFQSVGYDTVFWTRLGTQLALFAGALLVASLVLFGNLFLAGRLAPAPTGGPGGSLRSLFDRINEAALAADPDRRPGSGGFASFGGGAGAGPAPRERAATFDADDIPDLTPIASVVLLVVAALGALTIAGSVAASWETVLLYQNRVPFSPETASAVVDPVFGQDVSFFLFELPFLRLIQAVFNGIVVAALILVFVRYIVAATRGSLVFATPVRVHLATLAALFLLSVAFGYQLDKYELVYSSRGIATGVSFTDQNAQFFAFDLLTILSGLAAALLVGGAFTRMLWPLGLVVSVWFLSSIVVGRLYPEAIQRFTVEPNQYAQEERYIANNIAMTRLAFGLDVWEDNRPFRGEEILTREAIENEVDTFTNARLWDYRPLGATLDQLQRVRRYYDFHDVDTDRYIIEGQQRQVMLSARELALDQNPAAVGFVNQRIVYTHGIGVAMVPVNEVANEGQPRLFIRNLPPVSSGGAPEITEPRIYFGERPSDYIITGAVQAEFDFPTGEGEGGGDPGTETRWTGTSGIKLDTTLMRLLFAARFRDLDLLISNQVTVNSQLLMHRHIADRMPRIAPFLAYDKDPYLVITDEGRLMYIQDAYTMSDRFPHAQYFDPRQLDATNLGGNAFNYIRNSVKITMDAYTGDMAFYVTDDSDPIIRAYSSIFPDLFSPIDEMPADQRDNVRFPEELFNVQTRVFGRYHVTNPLRFFQSDDLWTVPQGQTNEQSLPSEAYYVIMRMPGEDEAEFLLLQPMVPTNRPNMIAWIAARNDGDDYGTIRVYRFPPETTVFGPAQIEARIDQDPAISEQFTLWRNSGSNVIRGNMIVVPVGDSLIYLQPVYLQSTGSAFPEFRRIVVASPREVVWADTLSESIRLLLEAESGNGPSPSPSPTPDPGEPTPSPDPGASPTPTPGPTIDPSDPLPDDVAGLIEYANVHFELAQAALRDGDFATYGEEIAKVEAALLRLDQLAPELGLSPDLTPAPSASPAP
jgi:uncharacterized membrane protein (UPF0182 family)